MRIPVIRGIIDRRLLVNFRVDPAVLRRILPKPFRPWLVKGMGMAGICLIRLKGVRPRGWPACLGLGSENAAHRIAVEWTQGGETLHGVFIPRRDTSSRLNALVGGRLFPGVHHRADFLVRETAESVSVAFASRDDQVYARITGRICNEFPSASVFSSLQEASNFFRRGSLGYSMSAHAGILDGLELCCSQWHMQPVAVDDVASSFFADQQLFPAGAVQFDCALVMRGIEHEWHSREPIRSSALRCSRLLVPAG